MTQMKLKYGTSRKTVHVLHVDHCSKSISVCRHESENRLQIVYQSKANSRMCRHSCDLDLDLMVLIYELYLYMPKIYLRTKNEHFRSRHLKFRSRTGLANMLFCSITC